MLTRLGAYSLGFLSNQPLKRALSAAGYDIRFGPLSRKLDGIAVWGDRPVAARAKAAARRRDLPCVFVEDAFLRSVRPEDQTVLGLTIDKQRPYFDTTGPSDLEDLLNAGQSGPDMSLAMDEYLDSGLSKYNHAWSGPEILEQGSAVLVVDQRPGDASIRLGQANAKDFARALEAALDENPHHQILLKAHPRGQAGHFDPDKLPDRVKPLSPATDPVLCIQRCTSIYCVTSQLGFEAILHGKRPRVFGQPFYAGWGLSDDAHLLPRRSVQLDRHTLFRTVMLEYCKWFDPETGAAISFVDALRILAARTKHARTVANIRYGAGISPWKRPFIRKLIPGISFVPVTPDHFRDPNRKPDAQTVVWASKTSHAFDAAALQSGQVLWKMEDGFIRSKGLGAALTPPRSLVLDRGGIYYDPGSRSVLQHLFAKRARLTPHQMQRAEALLSDLRTSRVSKYNLPMRRPALRTTFDASKTILVPGQVEDDASVLTGGQGVRTNSELLDLVRAKNPDAYLIYKPHPDVVAGFRTGGHIPDAAADFVDDMSDPLDLIQLADEVWTLTSLLGFEALLRGKKVFCVGRPFYAGWGQTHGVDGHRDRSRGDIGLNAMVHAALIDYPLYFSPASGQVTSPEQHLVYLAADHRDANPLKVVTQRSLQIIRERFRT